MDERKYSSWLLERLALGEAHRLRIGSSTIGRHSSSVIRILDSHFVSRNHAKIEVSDDDQRVEIQDLNSVNGIFVNRVLFRESIATLQAGDQIGIGVIVDEDVNNADPEHPVFVLKYLPLQCRTATNRQRPCPLSFRNRHCVVKPTAAINPSIISKSSSSSAPSKGTSLDAIEISDELPSTSVIAVANAVTTATGEEACITISDDEDEFNVKNEKKTNSPPDPPLPDLKQQTSPCSAGVNVATDEGSKATKIKDMDIICVENKNTAKTCAIEESTASFDLIKSDKNEKTELNKQTHTTLNSNEEDLIVNQTQLNSNETTPPNIRKERASSADIAKNNTSEKGKDAVSEKKDVQQKKPTITSNTNTTQTTHMPIMSSIKQERVRTVSAEIKNIFGETDEVIMDKVKDINPYIYKTLNGENCNQLNAGECINLLSEDECEDIGLLIPATTTIDSDSTKEGAKDTKESTGETCVQRTASPNIFESSLNDSNEDGNIKSKQPDDFPNSPETQHSGDLAYELRSDDEEFMFSQVVINDMKAELADDNIDDCMADLEQVIDEMQLTSEPLKNETDKLVAIKKELDSSVWSNNHDDDEDFDEELENKVSDWSAKLFSQSLTQGNMSQIYDVDYDEDEDEEEDGSNQSNKNEVCVHGEATAEEDNEFELNFHNGNTDNFIDELYQSLQQKCLPTETEAEVEQDELLKINESSQLDSPVIKKSLRTKKRMLSSTDEEQDEDEEEVVMPETHKNETPAKHVTEIANNSTNKSTIKEDIPVDIATDKKSTETLAKPVTETPYNSINKSSSNEAIPVDVTADKKSTETPAKPVMETPYNTINKSTINKAISVDIKAHKTATIEYKSTLPKDKKTSEITTKTASSSMKTPKRRKSTVGESYNNEVHTAIDSAVQRKPSDKAAEVLKETDKAHIDELKETIVKPSTSSTIKEKTEVKDKPKIIRGPPTIIDAPQLPKHKGKLRGVSACPSTSKEKLNSVREYIRNDNNNKELKRKWLEKPSLSKKRDKERSKVIKDSRKELLKELAKKQHKLTEASRKRKSGHEEDSTETSKRKKPKVKVTAVNRGAFLSKKEDIPAPQNTFKIPKIVRTESISAKDFTKLQSNNELSTDAAAPVSITKTNPSPTLFEEILSKPDLLLARPKQSFADANNTAATRSSTDSADVPYQLNFTPAAVSKASVAARAKRTTNKITFASMQRNFVESHQNQKKLENLISNTHTCMIDTEKRDENVERKKKKVRFNDTPIIYYIERTSGATKKVDKKDVMPQSTINNRRQIIRSAFPIVDCTSKIISMFLTWSNDWLEKRNADAQGAGETILPMSNQFTSYDCYKNVLFPLMKLEFLCGLEREFKQSTLKPFKVSLEYITDVDDRLMLITKYNSQVSNKSRFEVPRCDLVILDFNDKHNGTFAYVSANRKGTGTCSTFVFEIIGKNYTKAYLNCIKEINVRPVVDNIRIEFGAFNAVYQLESTPLFNKIINPLELLKCKPISKHKIKYKGFHPLNSKQEQILLNTYAKIIDETTPNITLIKGPPGTGKSCLITNLALQSMYGEEVRCMDKKILICAQSNGAVDVIAAKLYDVQQRMRPEIRFRVIRYGMPDKISPDVVPISLQKIVQKEQIKQAAQHNKIFQENKENIKNDMLALEAQILDMQQRNIKGTVEEDELIEKNKQLQLMRSILNQTIRPEDERSIYTWHLTNANIVCTTLSSCVKLSQYVNYFDICIIDEATQCTEPWTLLPLKFGINSLVLVGDTQQLPATVLSKKAMDLGFCNSMFTRIQRCLETVHSTTLPGGAPSGIICSLQTQYRMHAEICRWPNLYFYKNELINAQCTMTLKTPITPFSVINLAYSQNEHCNDGKISNNLEAEFVVKLLKALDGYIPNKYNSYGVITPYVQHRMQLESSLKASGLTNIMVNTIDSYQGLEKDVIVISNARTRGIGFLSNYQRLNVALTRPKKCLILCGNFKNLESVPSWRSLLNNARERKVYHEISAECALDIHRNVIEKIKIKQ